LSRSGELIETLAKAFQGLMANHGSFTTVTAELLNGLANMHTVF